jgi:LPXTG-motif cell wall-anchored protein
MARQKGYKPRIIMEEIGSLFLLAGLLGLVLSLFLLGRRKRSPGRSLPDNFDFVNRKHSEHRR